MNWQNDMVDGEYVESQKLLLRNEKILSWICFKGFKSFESKIIKYLPHVTSS